MVSFCSLFFLIGVCVTFGSNGDTSLNNNQTSYNDDYNYDLDTSHNLFIGDGKTPTFWKTLVLPEINVTDITIKKEFRICIDNLSSIKRPGVYQLMNDIKLKSSNDIIQVQSSNVIIDGNYHTLTCSAGLPYKIPAHSRGIVINGFTNVTIKNLKIEGCEIGVYSFSSAPIDTNHIIENLMIVNGSSGIVLHSGDRNIIRHTIIRYNWNRGIRAYGSDYNLFIDNDVTENRRNGRLKAENLKQMQY